MTSQIRAFIDAYAEKPLPIITVKDWIKSHNHEIWRICQDCGHNFDLRKELEINQCPKCKSKNLQ